MTPDIKSKSVYFGLLASQILAVACNTFLDIEYGSFTFEVVFWSCLYGYSINVVIKQGKVSGDYGKIRMNRLLIFALILTILVLIPKWGFPRAFIYFLALLQVSYNCVTTTRKQLYMSMLMSLVMVIFASAHYRADWSMLFYLIPYVIIVVFTIVLEQINNKSAELQANSLSIPMLAGKSTAIAAASISILLLGFFLYLITPKITIDQMYQGIGNPTAVGSSSKKISGQSSNSSSSNSSHGFYIIVSSNWPSSSEMRLVAAREGMPKWQASAIRTIADFSDSLDKVLKPKIENLKKLWDVIKEWLIKNALEITRLIILMVICSLIIALAFFIRETKLATWIKTRLDYLFLGVFQIHDNHEQVVSKYYYATERLFQLEDIERNYSATVKEHFDNIGRLNTENRNELKIMISYFEDFRYGNKTLNINQVKLVNKLYRKIYRSLTKN